MQSNLDEDSIYPPSAGKYYLRLGIRKLKKQRLRSPTFFVNLQIVFACLEKVGDLGIYMLLLLTT